MIRLLAFLAMSVVWGVTWIAARWAFEAAPPVFVAGLRLVCASLCFWVWTRIAGLSLAATQPVRLLVSALLINTACYSFLFWGVDHAPTGLAAVINLSLVPVFSMGIGALVGEERITVRRVLALAVGAAGLALLFLNRPAGLAKEEAQIGLGLAAVVIGTFAYAWGAIVAKPLVREMPPVALAFWSTLLGGLALLPIAVAIEGFDLAYLTRFSQPRPLAGFLVLIGGGSLVGFSVYLWLLREWGAFRAGLYAFVSPIIAVAIGVLVQGEPFGWAQALGMAVMLTATALVVRPEREPLRAS